MTETCALAANQKSINDLFCDQWSKYLLGICGGGGYSLAAAQTDKRFKSIATVSMFNSGRVRRNGLKDSQLDTIQQRLQQASAARAQEAAGGEILYSGDANLTDEQILISLWKLIFLSRPLIICGSEAHRPNRCRYSTDVMNAFTISA